MGKKKDNLFNEYKRIMTKAGIYDPRLDPQIRAAANTESIINQLTEEQEKRPLVIFEENTKGGLVEKESPLLGLINKYMSLHMQQLRAIGLNYDATPSKIQDAPTSGQSTAKRGGIAGALAQGNMNFQAPKNN